MVAIPFFFYCVVLLYANLHAIILCGDIMMMERENMLCKAPGMEAMNRMTTPTPARPLKHTKFVRVNG